MAFWNFLTLFILEKAHPEYGYLTSSRSDQKITLVLQGKITIIHEIFETKSSFYVK